MKPSIRSDEFSGKASKTPPIVSRVPRRVSSSKLLPTTSPPIFSASSLEMRQYNGRERISFGSPPARIGRGRISNRQESPTQNDASILRFVSLITIGPLAAQVTRVELSISGIISRIPTTTPPLTRSNSSSLPLRSAFS